MLINLLNLQFPWDKNYLNNTKEVEGAAIINTEDMVIAAIKRGNKRKQEDHQV